MSYSSIEIICGKCGNVISKMVNLKSIKDSLRPSKGRCTSCGSELNPYDFSLSMEKV